MKQSHASKVSVLAFGLALAGCGGGGNSGVISTLPSPAYPTMASVVNGSYDLHTAGVAYTASATTGFTNGSGEAFGSDGRIVYNATSDTFTLIAPGGVSQSFTAVNLVDSGSPTTVAFVKNVGSTQDQVVVTVPLTYAMVTVWNRLDINTNVSASRIQIGGSPTQANHVPRSGSATYAVQVGGAARAGGTTYNIAGSSGTFSANFANNTVQTSLNLSGTPSGGAGSASLGTFNGTGTISASGPGISGTLTGPSASGVFSGSFFGPSAVEVGYGYVLTGAAFSAAGVVIGTKQ